MLGRFFWFIYYDYSFWLKYSFLSWCGPWSEAIFFSFLAGDNVNSSFTRLSGRWLSLEPTFFLRRNHHCYFRNTRFVIINRLKNRWVQYIASLHDLWFSVSSKLFRSRFFLWRNSNTDGYKYKASSSSEYSSRGEGGLHTNKKVFGYWKHGMSHMHQHNDHRL